MIDKTNEKQTLLQERAELLAKPLENIKKHSERLMLRFYVNSEKYALPDEVINKIIPYQPVTKLPFVIEPFKGIIYHSGVLWPILDTSIFFQEIDFKNPENIILLSHDDYNLALLTNRIIDQVQYMDEASLAQLHTDQMARKNMIRGIIDQEIALIDFQKLFHWFITDLDQNKGVNDEWN